ncbi:tRNA (adenosine(37)-N6)-threonylcarbamoyltransferase complex ATPase subunit type 1 TsaE [Terrilactibacillus sp. BCM23-1]|uniref:tRNA threonylcarbamoyladenosine biosynthesis protein TsaE n=1 Tax=Terrilactibacillus tamarindi TaxID=2599694 RepID=A0A6N8CNW2_9BACI|nr:tRNA (adenosine(37)-N6)-threonylcarbamoyltransferase complex ATPase subunit type 1 TsaE [Terrilactibacillus tamarindi]MTT30837.1 tRNA (adenosine(37)-N6)-threonylcarbamoyltransferase complex ATPase subunit type 1 TsaE [Terrilactibacillus tamarindi]
MNYWILSSPEETQRFGKRLAEFLQAGDVLTLSGDLGAGKTTFTKGLAVGLGITKLVNSPTYTIVKEYTGRLPLYHMDVYRITDEEDIGLDDYFDGSGVVVVEWSENIKSLIPDQHLEIQIERLNENQRKIILIPHQERFERMCKEFNY